MQCIAESDKICQRHHVTKTTGRSSHSVEKKRMKVLAGPTRHFYGIAITAPNERVQFMSSVNESVGFSVRVCVCLCLRPCQQLLTESADSIII